MDWPFPVSWQPGSDEARLQTFYILCAVISQGFFRSRLAKLRKSLSNNGSLAGKDNRPTAKCALRATCSLILRHRSLRRLQIEDLVAPESR